MQALYFGKWHGACASRYLVERGVNGKLSIVCLDCGVAVDVESVSAKISPAEACTPGAKNVECHTKGVLVQGVLA